MKYVLHQKRKSGMQFQRNSMLGLSACLLLVVILQSLFLFFRHEKIILMPPELKQSFWVEGNTFSPTYLEEQGLYVAHLLLDVSEANILYQGEVVLRYTDPSHHSTFKAKILEDQKRLKKDNLALTFVPIECEVFPDSLTVEITGDLNGYVGSKKVTSHRETYRVSFDAKQARLFLKDFQTLKTDTKGVDIDAPALS